MILPSLHFITDYCATLPAEVMIGAIFTCGILGLLIMARFFGLIGLFTYGVMAIFISNIQVLKATHLSFLNEPVALGTEIFCLTFLITDIVTEYYSSAHALKIIWLGFISMIVLSIIMVLTIGVKPVTPTLLNPDLNRFLEAHQAMKTLFFPAPALFLASLISYFISQVNDVWIYTFLKQLTRQKYLWLRAGVATAISSLLDTFIFSFLAWVVFAETPIAMKTLFWTYGVGTYSLRLLFSLINIPVVYLAGKVIPKNEINASVS